MFKLLGHMALNTFLPLAFWQASQCCKELSLVLLRFSVFSTFYHYFSKSLIKQVLLRQIATENFIWPGFFYSVALKTWVCAHIENPIVALFCPGSGPGASQCHEGATETLEGRHQDEVFSGWSIFLIHWTQPKGVYWGGFTLTSCGSCL